MPLGGQHDGTVGLRREGRQVPDERGKFAECLCPKGTVESQLEVVEAEASFGDAALEHVGHVLALGIGSEQCLMLVVPDVAQRRPGREAGTFLTM
jgi:hypothetical protein